MKKYLSLMITLSLTVLTSQVISQTLQWQSLYNGPASRTDHVWSFDMDQNDNLYVIGTSQGPDSTTDYFMIKYDANGQPQWTYRHNGPAQAEDYGKCVIVSPDGNIYSSGAENTNTLSRASLLMKHNSSGTLIWKRVFTDPVYEAAGIIIDAGGNIYVAGYAGGSINNAIINKYDSSGTKIWSKMLGGSALDYFTTISIDSAGNIVVGGQYGYIENNENHFRCITAKYNTQGDLLWSQTFGGYSAGASRVITDNHGNTYTAGKSSINQGCLLKYNYNGSPVWSQQFVNTGSYTTFDDLSMDGSENLIVGGNCFFTASQRTGIVRKYNNAGQLAWSKTIDNSIFHKITIDRFNNIYAALSSNNDYLIIKYDNAGNEIWRKVLNSPDNYNDFPSGIKVNYSASGIFITGSARAPNFYEDFFTVKLSQLTGLIPLNTGIPENFSLRQNYPNPFNPITHIRFDIAAGRQHVNLTVYNSLGKEAAVLVNKDTEPGSYEYTFDGSELNSGVYFYTLIAGDFSETKKMLLIK